MRRAVAVFSLIAIAAIAFAQAEEPPRPSRDDVRAQLRSAPRFAGPAAWLPSGYQVSYDLPSNAAVAVTILDLKRLPMRTFQIPAGRPGSSAGENTLTIWDGRDAEGREAPSGEYWASVSATYPDGGMENKRIRVVKP